MISRAPTSIFAHKARIASNQAIEWLARLQATDVTAAEKAQFAEWLHADPLHKTAFDDATTLWEGLAVLPEQTSDHYQPSRWRRWPLAAAATVVLGFLIALAQLPGDQFETGKGEQRRVVLSDGSTTFLNTASAIEVQYGKNQRRIEILDGEVWFDVVKDAARPFIVVGEHATAEAVGTAFVVHETPGFTRIGVSEGVVKSTKSNSYNGNLKSILLSIDEQATFSEQQIRELEFDSENVLAWRSGWLKYNNVTLGDLVEDLNRYVAKPMVINDAELAAIRVGANFEIQDQEAMLEALSAALPLKWSDVSDRVIIITKS